MICKEKDTNYYILPNFKYYRVNHFCAGKGENNDWRYCYEKC